MVRRERLTETEANGMDSLPLPEFESTPWASGPSLSERRVALIATSGLHQAGAATFTRASGDYRVLPRDMDPGTLQMSHVSTNYDRSGFQADVNVAYPMDRIKELAMMGEIGSVAELHYSFMGAIAPEAMEASAREVAGHLKNDGVDAVLLCPV